MDKEEKTDTRFYMYGPNGQSEIFEHESQVPDGWYDHPNRVPGGHPLGSETIERTQRSIERRVASRRKVADHGSASLDPTGGGDENLNRGNPQGDPDGATQGGETGQPGQPLTSLPEYDDITKQALAEQLSVRKVPHNPQWEKQKLYDLLKDTLQPAPAQ